MSNFDFIGAIVEIVLWCIDCVREIIKNKQKNHDKDIEAEPKWGINNLPLELSEGNVDHEFGEVYFYIFTVSTDGELRVNSTKDMNFMAEDSEVNKTDIVEKSYKIYPYPNAAVKAINREKGTNKIMLNFNNVTLKKDVTVKVIIIESTTDRGKKAYYLYGDGVRGQIVSESNPTLIKYLKIKNRVELCNHNRANEFTTTTTTLAPGYDY
ncbi:hypothetical protein GBO69_08760 [Pediococcus pentosaceus]|uniref:hypothetical protein n=1 Tax=Pediococcus pentosaceus TaxID=1255 RepID=UPI0013257805|nr:hypothetical protein [Pediococcus pentosaceus]KAF0392196.1 hypothetical protein GBO69_08760 [Pediococcus pentosaceus]